VQLFSNVFKDMFAIYFLSLLFEGFEQDKLRLTDQQKFV
jgi:hypothetical protein